jgi:hypothetical protein
MKVMIISDLDQEGEKIDNPRKRPIWSFSYFYLEWVTLISNPNPVQAVRANKIKSPLLAILSVIKLKHEMKNSYIRLNISTLFI